MEAVSPEQAQTGSRIDHGMHYQVESTNREADLLDLRYLARGPFSGAPADMKIISQTLRIERAGVEIRMSGETEVGIGEKTITSKDDTSLKLNGAITKIGPVTFTFHPIDAFVFEITTVVEQNGGEYQQLSRFVFSPDGATLTETKSQTERALPGNDILQTKDKVVRTSTFALVFSRDKSK